MKIHPAADLFPMMAKEELEDLAQDIVANGLVHPIVIDEQKQVIDGRNRLAACKIANVEPRFEQLNGRDALAYIVSANLARRNLTKGQQAMALAMIYPEPHSKKGKETLPFSKMRLSQARSLLRHSRDLAQSVLKGALPFDEALVKVEEARVQASSTEARLTRLQTGAPDLAARVSDENISLDEALAILNEREINQRRTREAGRTAAEDILGFAGQVSTILSAIDAGEDIRIPADQLKILETALGLLTENMRRK